MSYLSEHLVKETTTAIDDEFFRLVISGEPGSAEDMARSAVRTVLRILRDEEVAPSWFMDSLLNGVEGNQHGQPATV